MRMNYEFFRLNSWLKRLEHKIYERAYNKNNIESNAYLVWQFLMDNGPSTSAEIKNIFPPSQRASIASVLTNAIKDRCISKQGNNLIANPNYVWDDVGVITRDNINSYNPGPSAVDIANASREADRLNNSTSNRRRSTSRQPREPRVRTVIPNLFSRNFDEVKAAIEAGESVDTRDSKGRTPLAWACSDTKGTSGPIIRYLLNNGADPNDHVGRLPCIFATLLHNNIDGAKALLEKDNDLNAVYYNKKFPFTRAVDLDIVDADLLASLVPSGIRRFNSDILVSLEDLFKKQYITGKISSDEYSNILRRIFSSTEALKSVADHNVTQRLINLELQNNKHNLYDIFLENGILPTLLDNRILERCSRSVQEYLYNAYKDASEGKVSFGDHVLNYIRYAIAISRALNKPYSFIYNFINKKWVNNPDNSYALDELIDDSIYNDKIEILKAIAKNITTADSSIISHIINMLCSNYRKLNKEQSSYLCRILNKIMPDNYNFTHWDAIVIAERGNPYFIEFLFDHPSIDNLLKSIKSNPQFARILRDNPNQYSNFIKALNDSGRTVGELVVAAENQPEPNSIQDSNDDSIKDIVECIYRDTWERSLDIFLRDNPDALFDERIADALDDPKNADSVTANRIRNMINRLPQNIKDKYTPKYDF